MGVQFKPLLSGDDGEPLSPVKPFDPKAFTRETWKQKPRKPKSEGPLVSFNVHPDAYIRQPHDAGDRWHLSRWNMIAIKWVRIVQLLFRLVQAVAAVGVLFLFIIFTKTPGYLTWIMRITGGVASLHCCYSVYHHARNPAGRAPGSTTAYQGFSALIDGILTGVYIYGFVITKRDNANWSTFMDVNLLDTFRSAATWGLIGAAGSHFFTMLSSVWLSWIFSKVSSLPPDLNPLEIALNAKRHKSKASTISSESLESLRKNVFRDDVHRLSIQTIDELNSPRRSIPFLETLSNPGSPTTSYHSRTSLPNRQYQIVPENRGSMDQGRFSDQASLISSRPPTAFYTPRDLGSPRSRPGTGYTVPRDYDLPPSPIRSRPTTGYQSPTKSRPTTSHGQTPLGTPRAIPNYDRPSTPTRAPKNQKSWMAADSLVSHPRSGKSGVRIERSDEALEQLCNGSDEEDEESDEEDYRNYIERMKAKALPDPLRAHHPDSPSGSPAGTPRISTGRGLDQSPIPMPALAPPVSDVRKSSIQDENQFSVKSYGALGGGNKPVTVGSNRQVSSGTDMDERGGVYGRRNVSGRLAEEGYGNYKFQ